MKRITSILLLFICASQTLLAQCDHPDVESLIQLYNSTGGENWIANDGWKTASSDVFCNPCDGSWTGVECINDRVTIIEVPANNLRGKLEDLHFEKLIILNLSNNNLDGTIPDFSDLERLQTLQLSNNNFSGTIPNFQNLPSLTELTLDNNNLIGPIPYFEKCLNMNAINISFNEMNDTIPDFDDLINLGVIQLNSAGIFGSIPSFSNNPKMLALVLSNNKLTGSIAHLEDLPELLFLLLDNNMLSGCMPFIADNTINGAQFVFLEGNTEIAWLGNYSLFQANGFANLGAPCSPYDLPGARGFLDENCDCNPLACSTSHHPDLAELMRIYDATNGDDWINNYGWIAAKQGYRCDPCDDTFGTFYGITCEDDRIICIDLDGAETCDFNGFGGNNLTGEWPKELDLGDLELLILDDNQMTGSIPDISLMYDLKELRASRNNFTGSIPDLKANKLLETVRLGYNNLSGDLPFTMGTPKLEYMTVTDNNFSGCFSPWICSLELFEASGNDDLPWYGDRTNYCDNVPQFMAPCGDSTMNFGILMDCSCGNLSTSIQDAGNNVINIFPNPTYDYLNIVSHIQTDLANVYNMQGKLVTSQTVSNAQVDVTDLIKGIYLIEIVSENKTTTLQKFVKL